MHGKLCRAVLNHVRRRNQGRCGGHVDDGTADDAPLRGRGVDRLRLLGGHRRRHRARDEEGPLNVHPVEVLELEEASACDRGVGSQRYLICDS